MVIKSMGGPQKIILFVALVMVICIIKIVIHLSSLHATFYPEIKSWYWYRYTKFISLFAWVFLLTITSSVFWIAIFFYKLLKIQAVNWIQEVCSVARICYNQTSLVLLLDRQKLHFGTSFQTPLFCWFHYIKNIKCTITKPLNIMVFCM